MKEIEARRYSHNYSFDYIDLGSGPKPLKVNLSGFNFDPRSYDEDHGEGAAKVIISGLRKAAIAEYKKNAKENSFASLLSQIGSAIEKQENQNMSSTSSVNDKKDGSPRPTR